MSDKSVRGLSPTVTSLLLLGALMPMNVHAAFTFTPLGDLNGGSFHSGAYAVSADGSTVVGRGYSAIGAEAFRWTVAEGMIGLGEIPGGASSSFAVGVSADGASVVGSSQNGWGPEGFLWTASSGMVGLGQIPVGGSRPPMSFATDISADGSTIVGRGEFVAARWTMDSGWISIDEVGEVSHTRAHGVSADGSIIVGLGTHSGVREALRWTAAEGMVGLGDLDGGSFDSNAIDISDDGSTIVGRGNSTLGDEAFRWTAASGMVGLGDLPGGSFESSAQGVSADGSTVVGYSVATSGDEAFIWTKELGMVSMKNYLVDNGIDLAGWTLQFAGGVSADGRTIVGYGLNPHGQTEAWVAVVPESSTLLFASVGAIALVTMIRRNRLHF